MAVCAPWIRSDNHAPAGVATQAKLTFEPDHSIGADQKESGLRSGAKRITSIKGNDGNALSTEVAWTLE